MVGDKRSYMFSMTWRVVIFYIFNIILLSIPSFKIFAGYSIRIVLCTCLIIYSLIIYSITKRNFVFDRIIKYYFAYILFYILANIINGELYFNSEHLHILTNHYASLSVILFLPIVFHSEINVKAALLSLLFILFTTLLFSYLQFVKNDLGWLVGQLLINENISGQAERIAESTDSFIGTSVIVGIFNSAVTNGYYISTFLPLVMVIPLFFIKYKKYIFDNLIFVVVIVVSFYLQQRACMLLVLLFIVYYYYRYVKKFRAKGLALVFIILLFVIFYLPDLLINTGTGRFTEAGDTRSGLLVEFYDWVGTNSIFWGGIGSYRLKYIEPQHNTLLSAWVLGGFFCFVIMTILIVSLLIKLYKFSNDNDLILKSSSLCGIFYVFNSMLHSAGIQNKATMFWIIYMIFITRLYRTKYKKIIRGQNVQNNYDLRKQSFMYRHSTLIKY